MAKLTGMQELFCQEYLKGLNATQAAIRAGYSKKTSRQQGAQMLRDDKIAKRIAELQGVRSERTEITQDWVLTSLKEVAERCMEKVPVMEFDVSVGGFVESGKWQFNASGANKSLELIGKHLGMFIERHSSENLNVDINDLTNAELDQVIAGASIASVIAKRQRK